MRKISLLTLFFTTLTASAQEKNLKHSSSAELQIKNPGFEIKNDSTSTLPQDWGYTKSDGFDITLDNIVKHSGNQSLQITNSKNTSQGVKLIFNQSIPIQITNAKQLLVTAFIKTEKVKGRAGVTIHARDKNDQLIGVTTTQFNKIDSTANWKKYDVTIIVDKDVKKLVINGLLIGTGTAWFDGFTVTELSHNNTSTAKEVTEFLNGFIDTVQLHSLYRDSINWVVLQKDIKNLSAGLKTLEESHVFLNYILGKLKAVGDNHSFIMPKQINEKRLTTNAVENLPEGRYLGDNIGYIKVPGFNSGNDTAMIIFAEKIQGLIKSIDTQNKITGWIVDLREDIGGNMYPMIAGLGPIVGEDTLGYFFSGNKRDAWFYSNRGSGEANEVVTSIHEPYFIKISNPKIAVLVGQHTASSGEATAISFIGKSNTKLFGEPTGGYTTGNADFKLMDGSVLLLASSVEADRNMKKYLVRIHPDVMVTPSKNKDEDACLEAAKSWILNK